MTFFLHTESDRMDALTDTVVAAYKSLDLIDLASGVEREIHRSLDAINDHRGSGDMAKLYRERDILAELADMRIACSILLAAAVHDLAVAGDSLEKVRAPAVPYSEGA